MSSWRPLKIRAQLERDPGQSNSKTSTTEVRVQKVANVRELSTPLNTCMTAAPECLKKRVEFLSLLIWTIRLKNTSKSHERQHRAIISNILFAETLNNSNVLSNSKRAASHLALSVTFNKSKRGFGIQALVMPPWKHCNSSPFLSLPVRQQALFGRKIFFSRRCPLAERCT